ncbi:hypothetical protein O3M35_010251 [Rhynocoris fuscipes]|uniref:Uncharacterized protein n=1 Tax=Rhynocoris fuscipes TaxID=488301 RepID=A0AAW1D5Y9_9HEMI
MTRGRKQRKRERRAKEIERRENERRENSKIITEDCDRPQRGHSCDSGTLSLTSVFKNDEVQEIRNLLNINVLDDSHALLGAIALGRFDVLKRLLKNGHSLEMRKEGGLTPILWAVKLKQLEVTDFLLRRGANINATDPEENNALLLALQTPSWDQDTFLDFWNLLKDTNINLNHFNKNGSCALHYMVKRQWNIGLEMILSNSNVNINILNKKGVSAMMMACSRHQDDTFSILIKHNANILIEDERGCTALCYAIAYLMQKNMTMPNRIVDCLVNILLYPGSPTSLESYVQRRLDLIVNPPQENFNYTISTILMHIISFFSRCFVNGLDLLIALNLFKKLKLAIERNIENTEYCLCLFDIISEVITSHGKANNKIDMNGLVKSFSESNLLHLMLRFIKRNGTESLKNKDYHKVFRPLFYLSNHSIIKCWLQRNFKTLSASCNFILSTTSSPQLYPNEMNFQILKKESDDFSYLMGQLLNGEVTIREEKNNKKRRNDWRSRSVGKEDWSIKNQKQDAFMKKGIMSARKSEENLSTLKEGSCDDIINSKSDTYWTSNCLDADFDESNCLDIPAYPPKWQEEFKEGCALFGITPDSAEEKCIEPIWELELGSGDTFQQKHLLKNEEVLLLSVDTNETLTSAIEDEQPLQEIDNTYDKKIKNLFNLVENIIKFYENTWAKEYADGIELDKISKDDYQHLLKILPQLEKYHLGKLRSSWSSLANRLQEKWDEDKENISETLDQLIVYLSGIIPQMQPSTIIPSASIPMTNIDEEIINSSPEIKLVHDELNNEAKYSDTNNINEIDYIKKNQPSTIFPISSTVTIEKKQLMKTEDLRKICKITQNIKQSEDKPFLIPEYMLKNYNFNNEIEVGHLGMKEAKYYNSGYNRKQIFSDRQIFLEGQLSNNFRKFPPPPGFSKVKTFPQYSEE